MPYVTHTSVPTVTSHVVYKNREGDVLVEGKSTACMGLSRKQRKKAEGPQKAVTNRVLASNVDVHR